MKVEDEKHKQEIKKTVAGDGKVRKEGKWESGWGKDLHIRRQQNIQYSQRWTGKSSDASSLVHG